jgi:DNA modification methylase
MLAFALRADGWYLRQDIIWAKSNCMPESVKDRCTKSHEYIFLLSKNPNYYYDADAIRTPLAETSIARCEYGWDCDIPSAGKEGIHTEKMGNRFSPTAGANKRDVWSVPTSGGYTDDEGAHYATYSTKLIEPCILAGSREGGIVLDPFSGTATTGVAAVQNNRKYYGIELNEHYANMSRRRLFDETAQMRLF